MAWTARLSAPAYVIRANGKVAHVSLVLLEDGETAANTYAARIVWRRRKQVPWCTVTRFLERVAKERARLAFGEMTVSGYAAIIVFRMPITIAYALTWTGSVRTAAETRFTAKHVTLCVAPDAEINFVQTLKTHAIFLALMVTMVPRVIVLVAHIVLDRASVIHPRGTALKAVNLVITDRDAMTHARTPVSTARVMRAVVVSIAV